VPGIALWQVHYAEGGGADHNVDEQFIANKDESTSHGIRMYANRDGSFVVTNLRNDFQKRYPPHDAR
jgi:competence protein ComEC